MGKWLNRVPSQNKTEPLTEIGLPPISGSTTLRHDDIRHTPSCRPCGRPQHNPDVACPNPLAPDRAHSIAPGFEGTAPTGWDEPLADAWIAISLERIGKLHDELAPDITLDDPGWDRLEAIVSAAHYAKSRQALRDALDDYEAFARSAFQAWQGRRVA